MPTRLLVVPGLLALLALSACGGGSGTADDSPSASSGSSAVSSRAPYSAPADDGSGPCAYPSDSNGVVPRTVVTPPTHPTVSGTVTATVDSSIGTLTLSLDADTAPCTVNSFVALADQGYFDQTTCHRLTEADQTGIAVLQCGDPSGTGTGGPGYTIPDELDGNTGDYPAGTLAMANTGSPDSGGSQFFIVYGPSQLGPTYTVFGTVDATGLAAIQKAAQGGTDDSFGQGDGKPTTPVDISTVTIG